MMGPRDVVVVVRDAAADLLKGTRHKHLHAAAKIEETFTRQLGHVKLTN